MFTVFVSLFDAVVVNLSCLFGSYAGRHVSQSMMPRQWRNLKSST
jgi:hypothetical protein